MGRNNNNNNSNKQRKGGKRNQRLFDNWTNTVETHVQANNASSNRGRGRQFSSQKQAPTAKATRFHNTKPRMSRNSRSHRIEHMEQVATLDGSVSFASLKFELNPGLAATFPWLATQASGWDQYRFHKLEFYYKPSCATTKIGLVMMATDYDAVEEAPVSEIKLMTYEGATSDSSWSENWYRLDSRAMFPLGPRKYTRNQVVAGTDKKTYDVGNMFVAVDGQDNSDVIGRLYVKYDVELFVPSTGNDEACAQNIALFQANTAQVFAGTSTTSVLFDTPVVNKLHITQTGTDFVMPKGCFMIHAYMNVDSGDGLIPTVATIDIVIGGEILSTSRQIMMPPTGIGSSRTNATVTVTAFAICSGGEVISVTVQTPDAPNITASAFCNKISFTIV